jgi:hypothetical protein
VGHDLYVQNGLKSSIEGYTATNVECGNRLRIATSFAYASRITPAQDITKTVEAKRVEAQGLAQGRNA